MGIVLIVYGAIAIAAAPVVFRIAEERTLNNTGIVGAVFGLVLAISGIAVLLGSNAAGYVGVGANALGEDPTRGKEQNSSRLGACPMGPKEGST
jgi:hypothetical protein